MTALHRVKAYFGMVPADELDAYDGYGDHRPGRYDDRGDAAWDERRGDSWDARHDGGRPRYDELPDARYDALDDERARRRVDRADRTDRYDAEGSRARTPRPRDPEHAEGTRDGSPRDGSPRDSSPRDSSPRDTPAREAADRPARPDHREETDGVESSRSPRGRSWATNTGPNHTSVRPSPPAVTRSVPSLSPVSGSRDGSAARAATPVETPARTPEPKETAVTAAPSEITSLQPQSYNEARVIGERYRDGIPVIMNLSDMDDAAAKRLVDFAAGLAFALRGSIEKVTSRVFLLSPPNVEVSAADRRKFAENGYATRP